MSSITVIPPASITGMASLKTEGVVTGFGLGVVGFITSGIGLAIIAALGGLSSVHMLYKIQTSEILTQAELKEREEVIQAKQKEQAANEELRKCQEVIKEARLKEMEKLEKEKQTSDVIKSSALAGVFLATAGIFNYLHYATCPSDYNSYYCSATKIVTISSAIFAVISVASMIRQNILFCFFPPKKATVI